LDTRNLRLRIAAAGIASMLSAAVAVIGLLGPGDLEVIGVGGAVGIVIGAVLGWKNAERIRRGTTSTAAGRVLGMAAVAVPSGALLVTVVLAAMSVGSPYPNGGVVELVGSALFALMYGLLIFGLPAYALAVAVIAPWAWLVRHLPARLAGTTTAQSSA
jgi:hypothetical protein